MNLATENTELQNMRQYGFGIEAMKESKVCSECGRRASSDERFCMECGTKLPDKTMYDIYKEKHVVCTVCGTVLRRTSRYCSICGIRIAER